MRYIFSIIGFYQPQIQVELHLVWEQYDCCAGDARPPKPYLLVDAVERVLQSAAFGVGARRPSDSIPRIRQILDGRLVVLTSDVASRTLNAEDGPADVVAEIQQMQVGHVEAADKVFVG